MSRTTNILLVVLVVISIILIVSLMSSDRDFDRDRAVMQAQMLCSNNGEQYVNIVRLSGDGYSAQCLDRETCSIVDRWMQWQ